MTTEARPWVLDACVLYPTVLREILLGCAHEGLFVPRWSPRILEEWARTAERLGGEGDAVIARGEIARLGAAFPEAATHHDPSEEAALWLPDPADLHVLATALAARAEGIVTLNLRDFPRAELLPHGVVARHPDALLMEILATAPEEVARVAHTVHATAEQLSGEAIPLRSLLKRARLPRLGKALGR